MNDANKLSIAKASIQASTKGDEPLAHLLRNVAEGMFGPEPKGISIEHWGLLTRKRDARDEIMKRDADVLRGLKDEKANEPPEAKPDPQA